MEGNLRITALKSPWKQSGSMTGRKKEKVIRKKKLKRKTKKGGKAGTEIKKKVNANRQKMREKTPVEKEGGKKDKDPKFLEKNKMVGGEVERKKKEAAWTLKKFREKGLVMGQVPHTKTPKKKKEQEGEQDAAG